MQIVKNCSCGRSYTHEQWLTLPCAETQYFPATDNDPAELLEFRHCRCRSTIAIDVFSNEAALLESRARELESVIAADKGAAVCDITWSPRGSDWWCAATVAGAGVTKHVAASESGRSTTLAFEALLDRWTMLRETG